MPTKRPTKKSKPAKAAPAFAPRQRKWIAVDFDGVLANYSGYKGKDVLGSPMPGAARAIGELKKRGWRVLVYTTRPVTPKLKQWFKRHRIAYDAINTNSMNPPNTSVKPRVDVWLDDRAVCFTGSWSEALKRVFKFQPWYKKR